jgi:hypothetical protein
VLLATEKNGWDPQPFFWVTVTCRPPSLGWLLI